MNTQTPIYRMWSVGLSARDLERIRACMDAGHSLTLLEDSFCRYSTGIKSLFDADGGQKSRRVNSL